MKQNGKPIWVWVTLGTVPQIRKVNGLYIAEITCHLYTGDPSLFPTSPSLCWFTSPCFQKRWQHTVSYLPFLPMCYRSGKSVDVFYSLGRLRKPLHCCTSSQSEVFFGAFGADNSRFNGSIGWWNAGTFLQGAQGVGRNFRRGTCLTFIGDVSARCYLRVVEVGLASHSLGLW